MSTYQCEGFIKEVKVTENDVAFTLEPAAPYLFEKKEDGGKTERWLILVDDIRNPSTAKIIKPSQSFVAPKPTDFHSLIIAKSNRIKARLTVMIDDEANAEKQPLVVVNLDVM